MPSMCKLKIDELECTLADEEAAHQKTLRMLQVAESDRDWYKLLAWGMASGCLRGVGTSMATVEVEWGSGIVRCIGITSDDIGLPVHTRELEQALRQATKESRR
jgi:hypothetical protein